MDIKENTSSFIRTMIEFEKSIEKTLEASSSIDKFRKNDGRYSKERFRNIFVKKASLHIFSKYILIRIIEDTKNIREINSKLNSEGIQKWRSMSKNLKNEYLILFQLAADDLRREKVCHNIFANTVYDFLIPEIKNLLNRAENGKDIGYIEKLKDYDFKTIDANTIMKIIGQIYTEDDRKNFKDFYDSSPEIGQVLSMIGLE